VNVGKVNTLPNCIKAESVKRLRSLMFKNNHRLNMDYVHYTIVVKGKLFYAWYDEPLNKMEVVANGDK